MSETEFREEKIVAGREGVFKYSHGGGGVGAGELDRVRFGAAVASFMLNAWRSVDHAECRHGCGGFAFFD